MANRDTLAPRVAGAASAEALYNLAREAFAAPADLGYAMEILSGAGFTGDAGAKGVLDDISGSAMFTADFICCAMGYKALGDAGKADDMLGQGSDFAMSGEEKVAVGVAQMLVSGDAAAAAKTLGGALKEISTTEELYGLAKVVACDIKDNALAGQIYDKIKSKCGRAADFGRLAKTIAADLGDKVGPTATSCCSLATPPSCCSPPAPATPPSPPCSRPTVPRWHAVAPCCTGAAVSGLTSTQWTAWTPGRPSIRASA